MVQVVQVFVRGRNGVEKLRDTITTDDRCIRPKSFSPAGSSSSSGTMMHNIRGVSGGGCPKYGSFFGGVRIK